MKKFISSKLSNKKTKLKKKENLELRCDRWSIIDIFYDKLISIISRNVDWNLHFIVYL